MSDPQVNPDKLADKVVSALQDTKEDFTEAEVRALRQAALFIIGAQAAGAVARHVIKGMLWLGWVVLLWVAWKNGTLASFYTSPWLHPP